MTQPIGPIDASKTPRFAGLSTFARLPRMEDVGKTDIAVVGVPYDGGVSYRPGARFGPEHVRASSRLLRPYNPSQDFSPWDAVQIADAGDIAAHPYNISRAVEQIEEAMIELGEKVERVLTIGGDHTIVYPNLAAMVKKFGGPITVLHFDAHLDTWDTYFDEPLTHGTPFRRASEAGFIDKESSMHVGIRGPLYGVDDLEDDERLGFAIVSTDYIEENGVEAAIERILKRIGDKPLYISIDIDILDPAHAPGTGTPEAGGLTSRELLRIIRALATCNIVGAEVVEVAPAYDHAQITGIAASHVLYELMTALARVIVREREGK